MNGSIYTTGPASGKPFPPPRSKKGCRRHPAADSRFIGSDGGMAIGFVFHICPPSHAPLAPFRPASPGKWLCLSKQSRCRCGGRYPVFAPKIKTATCHVPNTRRASAPKPRFSGRQPRIPESRFPHKPETVPWVLRAKTQSPAKDRGLPRRARQDWPAGPLLFFVLQIINHNS
jgi:hypothetical protein